MRRNFNPRQPSRRAGELADTFRSDYLAGGADQLSVAAKAFSLLMALVVATLLLNWIMICLAHLRFRAAMRRKGRETQFKALFYPAGNYLCIAFLALILVLMCTMDDMRLSAILLPVWIVFLFIAFTVLRRKAH